MSSVQTMKSWATVIKSFEDVPRAFKSYFKAFSESCFPYTLLAPPYKSVNQKDAAKMIYTLTDRVVFLEKIKSDITLNEYCFKDIDYLETGRDLLCSWIKFFGVSSGKPTSSTVEYNTSAEEIFVPLVEQIRTSINEYKSSDLKSEQNKFDYLGTANYKFMNYAKKSIRQGETVISFVFQERIQKKFLDLYVKRFYRTVSTAHIDILADKELIIIHETDRRKGSGYGHIHTYIPLCKIKEASIFSSEDNNTLDLTLNLSGNSKISETFDLSNKSELNTLLLNLESLKTSIRI